MSSSQAVAVQDHITATRDVEGACAKWRQDMSVRYGSGQTVWPTVVKMTESAYQALLDQLTPMLVTGFCCRDENPHGRIMGMRIEIVDQVSNSGLTREQFCREQGIPASYDEIVARDRALEYVPADTSDVLEDCDGSGEREHWMDHLDQLEQARLESQAAEFARLEARGREVMAANGIKH